MTDPTHSAEDPAPITKQSTLTVGLMAALLSVFGAGAYFEGGFRKSTELHNSQMTEQLGEINAQLLDLRTDSWTRSDARAYHDMLQTINDDANFPPIPGH